MAENSERTEELLRLLKMQEGSLDEQKGNKMAADEEALRQMDEAAHQAEEELQPNLDGWSAKDMITWWAKWYLKAGHRRLGRLLVKISKRK